MEILGNALWNKEYATTAHRSPEAGPYKYSEKLGKCHQSTCTADNTENQLATGRAIQLIWDWGQFIKLKKNSISLITAANKEINTNIKESICSIFYAEQHMHIMMH